MGLNKYKGFVGGQPLPAENVNSIDPENVLSAKTAGRLESVDIKKFTISELLVVGGGGGGGAGGYASQTSRLGGGGGGGGLVHKNEVTVATKKSYAITIGAGGAGSGDQSVHGGNGGDTLFDSLITAKGGGGGGSAYNQCAGYAGGSGGGAGVYGTNTGAGGAGNQPSQPSDSGAFGFGNNGGNTTSNSGGAGGGGAGGAGANGGSQGAQGNGGAGKTVFGVTYSKGGNGGVPTSPTAGGANTGNGGDAKKPEDVANSYNGGSGIVVIKYLTANAAGLTITGGTITTDGDYTYHTFTTNGTFSVDGTGIAQFADLAAGSNNGKFKINVDGTVYDNVAVNLSGINSLNDVAAAVQAGIRAATGSTETCVYDGTKFVITSATVGLQSKILKLMSPSTGTDISGNGAIEYLGLGNEATEILGGSEEFLLIRANEDGQIPEEVLEKSYRKTTADLDLLLLDLFNLYASDTLRTSSDALVTSGTSEPDFVKRKEIKFNYFVGGTIRLKFSYRETNTSANVTWQLRKNGVVIDEFQYNSTTTTTKSYDIEVQRGDVFSIYMKNTASYGGEVSNFRLYYDLGNKYITADQVLI